MEIQTIKLSEKGQISIPKEIRDELKLSKGDTMIIISKGNQLILQKADSMLKRLGISEESFDTMLASQEVLKKDWDNKYDEQWNGPSMEEMFKQADNLKDQKKYTTKGLLSMIHERRSRM